MSACVHCGRTWEQVREAKDEPVAWLEITLKVFAVGFHAEEVAAKPIDLCSQYCLHAELDRMLLEARRAGLPIAGKLPSDDQYAASTRRMGGG